MQSFMLTLSGEMRSGAACGQPRISPDEFATEALAQLVDGRDNVLVGLSAGSVQKGRRYSHERRLSRSLR